MNRLFLLKVFKTFAKISFEGNEIMRVIVKKPNQESQVLNIELTLKEIQKIVEGYFEEIHIGYNLIVLENEEGILLELEDNLIIKDTIIKGTIIVVKDGGTEFAGLNDEEIAYVNAYIANGVEKMNKIKNKRA